MCKYKDLFRINLNYSITDSSADILSSRILINSCCSFIACVNIGINLV